MKFFKPFDWSILYYSSAQTVEILPHCNCITMTNLGDSIAYVNGKPLYPGTIGSIAGDSLSIGGNEGEIFNSKRLPISFTGGATNNLEVIQKYYIV